MSQNTEILESLKKGDLIEFIKKYESQSKEMKKTIDGFLKRVKKRIGREGKSSL